MLKSPRSIAPSGILARLRCEILLREKQWFVNCFASKPVAPSLFACGSSFEALGISVHCLAVFCLCHHFRFPGGHRQHFLLLRQIEMIKWQIGTHTQLEFSQFETDACPASGRAWITAGCSIIHNDKHTILFSCCRSTSYEWHSR